MTWILALIGVVFGFAAFVTFDSIVMLQHAQHRAEWEADGRPVGFFGGPDTRMTWFQFDRVFVRSVVFFRWCFVTPAWACPDAGARQLLRRYRACVVVANLALIALAVQGIVLR